MSQPHTRVETNGNNAETSRAYRPSRGRRYPAVRTFVSFFSAEDHGGIALSLMQLLLASSLFIQSSVGSSWNVPPERTVRSQRRIGFNSAKLASRYLPLRCQSHICTVPLTEMRLREACIHPTPLASQEAQDMLGSRYVHVHGPSPLKRRGDPTAAGIKNVD